MKNKFENKNVLVTGGASGIGKIMVRKALERKAASVTIWDINEEGMKAVQEEVAILGGVVFTHKVNIAHLDEIQTIAKQTKEIVEKIDILINNAGIVVGKYFHEQTHEDITKTFGINTHAHIYITKEFLPEMMANNFGAICNIASSAGLISNPKMSVYAASKWAIIGWGDSLRLEMKDLQKDIQVTTIMPYYINTGMFDGVKSKLLPILNPEKTAEKIIRAIEKNKKMYALPLPYRFIRLSQGLFPLRILDWIMKHIFGIYDTMKEFSGRK